MKRMMVVVTMVMILTLALSAASPVAACGGWHPKPPPCWHPPTQPPDNPPSPPEEPEPPGPSPRGDSNQEHPAKLLIMSSAVVLVELYRPEAVVGGQVVGPNEGRDLKVVAGQWAEAQLPLGETVITLWGEDGHRVWGRVTVFAAGDVRVWLDGNPPSSSHGGGFYSLTVY